MEKIDNCKLKDVFEKAQALGGLCNEDVTLLLSLYKDEEIREKVFDLAGKVKDEIYGRRVVFFSPLYVSNICKNDCLYCGFKRGNIGVTRKRLNKNELIKEVEFLINQGVKRILLVASEDPNLKIEDICEFIDECYRLKNGYGEIRRINVNIAPLTKEEFKVLKSSKIGTYQVFQETYNEEKYNFFHPSGPKSDFRYRYEAPFRAIEAGIDDIGMGILFGLDDPVKEITGLLKHIEEMKKIYGIGPHTISVPRLKYAKGAEISYNPPYLIDDDYFAYIVAVLRIAVPYTGIILSTRESKELRDKLIDIGVSQISAGSSTTPGGYSSDVQEDSLEQFSISDKRSISEMVQSLVKKGYIPSFCTACYRKGRTGEVFMELASNGNIKKFCDRNAILSFAEYIEDFSNDNKVWLKDRLISYLKDMNDSDLTEKVNLIFSGERDIYF